MVKFSFSQNWNCFCGKVLTILGSLWWGKFQESRGGGGVDNCHVGAVMMHIWRADDGEGCGLKVKSCREEICCTIQIQTQIQIQIQMPFWTIYYILINLNVLLWLFQDSFVESTKPNLSGIFGRKLCRCFCEQGTVENSSKSNQNIQKNTFLSVTIESSSTSEILAAEQRNKLEQCLNSR